MYKRTRAELWGADQLSSTPLYPQHFPTHRASSRADSPGERRRTHNGLACTHGAGLLGSRGVLRGSLAPPCLGGETHLGPAPWTPLQPGHRVQPHGGSGQGWGEQRALAFLSRAREPARSSLPSNMTRFPKLDDWSQSHLCVSSLIQPPPPTLSSGTELSSWNYVRRLKFKKKKEEEEKYMRRVSQSGVGVDENLCAEKQL